MEHTRNKLATAAALARQLGVSTRWLKAEADAGRIPALKADGAYLFVPDVVIALLVERAKTEARQ